MDGSHALHPKGGHATVCSHEGFILGFGVFCFYPVTFRASAFLAFSSVPVLRRQPRLELNEVVYFKLVV